MSIKTHQGAPLGALILSLLLGACGGGSDRSNTGTGTGINGSSEPGESAIEPRDDDVVPTVENGTNPVTPTPLDNAPKDNDPTPTGAPASSGIDTQPAVDPPQQPVINGRVLPPLPSPPLTPPPGPSSEPRTVTSPSNTVTEFFLVEDPPGRLPDDKLVISEEEFQRGSEPGVVTTPAHVNPVENQPPTFPDLENIVVVAGTEMNLRLRPVDPDGGYAGQFAGSLPVGARNVDNFDGTRSLIWRPLQPDVGIHRFTVTAVDPVEPQYRTRKSILIKVVMPADPSTIPNLAPAVNTFRPRVARVNDPVVFHIKGTDPNGTIPRLEIINPPPGATFVPHYNEPDFMILRFVPRTAGVINLQVVAHDSEDDSLTGSKTFVVDVRDAAQFDRPGPRLRSLAANRDLLLGFASLQAFYHIPDGALYADIAGEEFNFVSPENSLKWDLINPRPGRYQWAAADNLINFAHSRRMAVHGHTLIWYAQLPNWIKRSDPAQREGHMREYIDRVMTRYRDDIPVWDVVNEALEEDGSFRSSVWYDAMGEQYIDTAFRQARASAPDATLLYNDYDVSWDGPKSDALFRLLQNLQDQNTPIDGVGFQMHVFAAFDGYDDVARNFQRVADMGLDIYITELDVSMVDDNTNEQQAEVYRRILSICLEQPRCKAIQAWGFTDMYSWRRNFTPLLLDNRYQVKPAYTAIQQRLMEN